MDNLQKIEGKTNYLYGGYINYKAIKDYHLNFNLNDENIKPPHIILLAFIVEQYHKNDKMPNIIQDDKKYVMMNSNYILNNLIYLGIKESMLRFYLRDLKANKLIDVYSEIGINNRYINVNSKLIDLWYNMDWTISPINFMEQHKPHLWRAFKNEWEPHFKNKEEFKIFIELFNAERGIHDYSNNTKNIYEHLLNSVRLKLYGNGKT